MTRKTPPQSPAQPTALVGSIYLYGSTQCGFGYIACRQDAGGNEVPVEGNGVPLQGRSATDALWLAGMALRNAGVPQGTVDVNMDFNRVPKRALADLYNLPYFGQLKWGNGTCYTIKL